MADRKLSQIDLDLQEVEAALDRAKRGMTVNWETAHAALKRLIVECSERLPKSYEPHL